MFKRTKGCYYLAQHGFDINCSSSTELETIVLIAILDILQDRQTLLNGSRLWRSTCPTPHFVNPGYATVVGSYTKSWWILIKIFTRVLTVLQKNTHKHNFVKWEFN
jgi:hypothetical protein